MRVYHFLYHLETSPPSHWFICYKRKDRRNPAAVFCGFIRTNQSLWYKLIKMVREMVNTHTIQIPCRKDIAFIRLDQIF